MKTGRTEGLVQVLILIIVAGMAGAASFTHVHNWTMSNAPAGTGSWFGWANAIISELTPTAAGIEIRRRKRSHQPVGYPMAILIAAAALSLSAQVAEARPTVGGWISSAVPALAFLALTKLVLSRPRDTNSEGGEPSSATTASPAPAPGQTAETAPVPATPRTPSSASPAPSDPIPVSAASASEPETDTPADPDPEPSGQLLMSGRMTAFAHQQSTGQPITPGQLAERLGIPPALAGSILRHLDGTPPSVTAVNGTPVNGSRP
jgi:hypothetical protein